MLATPISQQQQTAKASPPRHEHAHVSDTPHSITSLPSSLPFSGNSLLNAPPGILQAKLVIGQPDDASEHEADDVADKVVQRMSMGAGTISGVPGLTAPPMVQRKCTACEQEEHLQRKNMHNSGSLTAPAAVSQQINAAKGSGNALQGNVLQQMQQGFGRDFSQVRIHTGPQAGELSQSLQARAFTVGNDIFFNRGEYQPETEKGRHLLAHELVHTLQQGKAGFAIQRTACPPRPSGEKEQSEKPEGILPVNVVEQSNELVIQDFAVGSTDMPQNVTNSMAWQRVMSDIAGDPSMMVGMQGHTDCTGSAQENLKLREERVATVKSKMPANAKAKVNDFFVWTTIVNYRDTNDTQAGRAANRAVTIAYKPNLKGEKDACEMLTKASNLDEYVFLVKCAEIKSKLDKSGDVKKFISMLRQIYYGNSSWSTSQNKIWHNVIPDRPWSSGDDPTLTLGAPLYKALKASQVVEGHDIGHLLTGVDAMHNPHEVELTASSVTFVTGLMNEEWGTWAGDVGSAAGEWAIASMYAGKELDTKTYFDSFAGPSDLKGNIDAFAIRQANVMQSNPKDALGKKLNLSQRLSTTLQDFFRVTGSSMGRAAATRYSDFVKAYGGVIVGGKITNKPALIAALLTPVEIFSGMYTLEKLLKKGYFDGQGTKPPSSPYMEKKDQLMVERYVDWLESQL